MSASARRARRARRPGVASLRWAAAAWLQGLAAAALLPAVPAASVAAAQEPVVLTLEDALARAADHNPQYRQALNQVDLAGPQARAAWGAFLPNLSLSYSTGQRFSREPTAVDFFGNPIENTDLQTRISSDASQYLSMSMDLLQGGARFHALGEARAQASVTRRTGERELNAVLAEVQRQFLTAQRQKARVAVELELLAARERDVEATRRRFELATVSRSDLLGTQLELETQRAAVIQARGEFDKGLLALARAIGDPGLSEIDVAAGDPEPFDPAALDLDGLVELGRRESPQVGEAAATLSLRQASLRNRKAARWPTLSLNSNFYRNAFGQDQTALFDLLEVNLSPDDFRASIGLSVSIPIFTRFETSRSIAEADVQLRNAGEAMRQTELEVEEQIRARYVDLETAWATVQERDRRLEIARERLRIVRQEYQLATKSVEDLRTAVREEASALRDVVDQRYEFATALVGLYEAAGTVAREAGVTPVGAGN